MKAILIDDETRARRVLKNLLLEFCPEVEVINSCSNVPDAVIAINKHNPDVVFCDIEMPNYSGLELLSFFQEVNFEIIFVTGYSEYAVKAFEVSAIDYLLKPVQSNKLELAVAKLKRKRQSSMEKRLNALKENIKNNSIHKIALPNFDGLQFVNTKDIALLEADGAYTHVFLINNNRIVVSKKIKTFELLLDSNSQFFRIHRSAIININHIENYSKAESYIHLINGKSVKIARDRKSDFEAYIKEIRI